MGNAIQFRMNNGVPGDLSRFGVGETVESIPFGATAFGAYGLVGKISGNTIIPPSLVGDVIYGAIARPFPMEDFTAQTGAPNSGPGVGTSTPPSSGIANVLTRGYMTVNAQAGAPALGGAVYVRYANPTGLLLLGGLEATAVAGSNVAVPNARWMGAADASGNAEIFFDSP